MIEDIPDLYITHMHHSLRHLTDRSKVFIISESYLKHNKLPMSYESICQYTHSGSSSKAEVSPYSPCPAPSFQHSPL